MTPRFARTVTIGTALAALLSACGGGSSGGGATGTVTTPTVSPAPTPSPTPSPTPTATTGTGINAMYTVAPDVASCRAGALTQATRDGVLASVNTIRALHSLPPVAYALADEAQATEAALMMAANRDLNHTPPTSWRCYSATGATGAGSSNLYGGAGNFGSYVGNDRILASWLDEVNNIVANNVGHRRWILDPFATRIAYGRTAQTVSAGNGLDYAALKVFGFTGSAATPSPLPPFVAYPYGDYPARFFDTRALLSFSAVIDTASSGANAAVDYARAQVTVTSGATSLAVSNVSYDTVGYGVPNNIQFAVAGLQTNVGYTVTITGVLVRGMATNYTYAFRITP